MDFKKLGLSDILESVEQRQVGKVGLASQG